MEKKERKTSAVVSPVMGYYHNTFLAPCVCFLLSSQIEV